MLTIAGGIVLGVIALYVMSVLGSLILYGFVWLISRPDSEGDAISGLLFLQNLGVVRAALFLILTVFGAFALVVTHSPEYAAAFAGLAALITIKRRRTIVGSRQLRTPPAIQAHTSR